MALDRFRVYNDIYGENDGDNLLRFIGKTYLKYPTIISGHLFAVHFITCMSIDEFDIDSLEEEIRGWLTRYNSEFEFVPRSGVYIVENSLLDVSSMCDRALLALKSIKGSANRRYAFYDDCMRTDLIEEQEIIGEMRSALDDDQFVVYLQPQYDYETNKICGAEALVRWEHPIKGLLTPYKFTPIFEKNGFINKIDQYVREQVCITIRRWLDEGREVIPISVNISRQNIYNPNLCDDISNLVKKYDLDPSLLRIEFTESTYVDNPTQLINMVNILQERGFVVEMDDFGSGYSSLNSLKDVPIDVLKLDMKFVQNDSIKERGGKILTAVVEMAHSINLSVIAEGVETIEQADFLKKTGCNCMQGYYFARPMPISAFEELISNLES